MASYTAPIRDINFVLNDVLNVTELANTERFADATADIVEGVVSEASKFVEEHLAPLNQAGDEEGCAWQDGEVTVPKGLPEAYEAFWQNGWLGLTHAPEYGGQGLPYVLGKAVEEMICSGNVAFSLYAGLTQGCYEALEQTASEEIKQTYLPKLGTGEWTGTMCMTEPQAGSDVGAVRTKAEPQADGSYALNGSKIFITSGEHSMADNIVHFVLARLPDSPPGVRGLSTFVVPKYLPNADGTPGERNAVKCLSIEEKMGIHASCTCTMAFDGAKGWIVGEPGQGIKNMFVMMNKARILVGMQGHGLCELATQNAIEYAKERKQGKPMTGGGQDVAIVEHPDVRRMLLSMKAITEGARVMIYETALAEDISASHADDAVREAAADWVELGTPLSKAFCTDSAVALGSEAVQVYGGHGFIREHGIEQIMRDAKILCLYEGTNGIQSMDLVRRKITMKGGALPKQFFSKLEQSLSSAAAELDFIAKPLAKAKSSLENTTSWLQTRMGEHPNDAGAAAVPYLRAFALTYLGWNWLRMAEQATQGGSDEFKQGKITTAKFFAERLLPEVHSLCAIAETGCGSWMEEAASSL